MYRRIALILLTLIFIGYNSFVNGNAQEQPLFFRQGNSKNKIGFYKAATWPPRTGKYDQEAKNIPADAELQINIPKDDPLQQKGLQVLGPNGQFWPKEGDFQITGGSIISKLWNIEKRARFENWTFSYKDPDMKEKSGWGPCLKKGEIILPISLFDFPPNDMFLENSFEAVDFGDKYILVRLDPIKNHSLCILSTENGLFLTVGCIGTKIEIETQSFERRVDGWYHENKKVKDSRESKRLEDRISKPF